MFTLKNWIYPIFIILVFSSQIFAQGTSKKFKFNFQPRYEIGDPPDLQVSLSEKNFKDGNNNGIIEAEERGEFSFELSNTGLGKAQGLKVSLIDEDYDPEFSISGVQSIAFLAPGQTETVRFTFQAGLNVKTREHNLQIHVEEHFGFDMDPGLLVINTQAFEPAQLSFSGYEILDLRAPFDKKLSKNEKVKLRMSVQNIGYNDAKDIQYRFYTTSSNVFINVSDREAYGTLDDLPPGAYEDIEVFLTVNQKVDDIAKLPVFLNVTEKYGRGDLNSYQLDLFVNKEGESINHMTIAGKDNSSRAAKIIKRSNKLGRRNEVVQIRDIDQSADIIPHSIAVVIGVEQYENMDPAPYASTDADVMNDYFKKVVGVEYVLKYTDNEVTRDEFENLFNPKNGELARGITPGETDLYVYYSGHGMPSKDGSDVYLFPYNGRKDNLEFYGYNINDLYDNLNSLDARSVTVIMDACFSGSSRVSGNFQAINLTGNKGLRIPQVKKKPWNTNPNFRVFSSSTMEQTSLGNDDSGTGLFTYHLAVAMKNKEATDQDKNGEITFEELRKYVFDKVSEESRQSYGAQDPEFFGKDDAVFIKYKN